MLGECDVLEVKEGEYFVKEMEGKYGGYVLVGIIN